MKFLTFDVVLREFGAGREKVARREEWQGCYIRPVLREGMGVMALELFGFQAPASVPWSPSTEDLSRSDWSFVDVAIFEEDWLNEEEAE